MTHDEILSSARFYAIFDKYPVNEGHVLLISRRHVPDLFGLSRDEFAELRDLLLDAKKLLGRDFEPDAYNIGANCGEISGQTIPHFHLHVIPRYRNDVAQPRGGIRNIKAPLVPYDAPSSDIEGTRSGVETQ